MAPQNIDTLTAVFDFLSPVLAAGIAEYVRAYMSKKRDKHGPDDDADH